LPFPEESAYASDGYCSIIQSKRLDKPVDKKYNCISGQFQCIPDLGVLAKRIVSDLEVCNHREVREIANEE